MIRLLFGVILIIAAIVGWTIGQTKKGQLGPARYYWLGSIVLVLLGLFLFISTSFAIVGPDEVGHLTRVYLGSPMPPGQVIAFRGQKGPQAEVLPPGFNFRFFLNVLYKVEMKRVTEVKQGHCGKILALDGQPLREGQIFADEWAEGKFQNMLNAEYFLKDGGQKGPQLSVLKPGKYRLNVYLFDVDTREKVTTVEAGHVGVVKSNVQQVPYNPEEVAKLKRSESSGLVAQLVPKGYIGIWNKPLPPGQYYLNRDAFDVRFIDTRVQTWKYLGGYKRRYIDLEVGQDGKIAQKEWDESFPVPEDAADEAISSRIEGWLVPIDLRVLVQVTPENAPFVIASVGGIKEVEDKILTPTIRSVVRNVTGSVEKRPGEEAERTVLDLIEKREQIESAIEAKIVPEGRKAGVTIKEVRIGDPAIPPELMVAKCREQLAEQLQNTFRQEKEAQGQRIETEKARAQADQQPELIKAQIKDSAAEFLKSAMQKEGEGEKLRLLEIAAGQKAQAEVLGEDRVMQLAMLKEILEAAKENPQIVKVPNILVQGATGGFEGAAAILGASNLTTGLTGSRSEESARQGRSVQQRR
ncbi:MAG: SPFH domain-containing protein [Planctomycetota bacterium]